MVTKSEIVLLAIIVLSTVAGGLATQHPSLVSLTYDEPSIAVPNSGSVLWQKCSTL
jgi:hypothetical protein